MNRSLVKRLYLLTAAVTIVGTLVAVAENKVLQNQQTNSLDTNIREYLKCNYPCSLTYVSVQNDNITVTGTLENGTNDAVLCEIKPWQHVSEIISLDNTVKIPVSAGIFTLSIDRYIKNTGNSYDRLLSKWVIAHKTANGIVFLSHARYPDSQVSQWNIPDEKPRSKKGLGGFHLGRAPESDLDDLGITSITVNITLASLIRANASDKTMPHFFNGKIYHIDKNAANGLDRILQAAAKRNIIVSAIILVNKAPSYHDPELGRIFQHPDCNPTAGHFSMANVTSPAGVEYYAAILDFIAQRYSRPDKQYGRIHHYIMHNEVDAGWEWTNCGEKPAVEFMDLYHKSMRIAYYTARKYNPHAKVLISLTHYWNWTVDPKYYHSRELLEIMLDFSKAEGDFNWGIAYHPYPQSLREPKTWLDKKCDFTFDTPLITFRNIEVLDAWVKQPETFFLGKHRRMVYLSEQGLNSPDYSEKSLVEQAAGMSYAWKKIKDLDGIDAFQYHNWIDNRHEGGLRIGLRKFPDDEKEPLAPKPIWNLYKDLDTPNEDKACELYLKVIGISNWNEIRQTLINTNQ